MIATYPQTFHGQGGICFMRYVIELKYWGYPYQIEL